MKKNYLILLLAVLFSGPLFAQYMKNSIGLRGGISEGITYQRFLHEHRDIKLLLSFRDNGTQLTLMSSKYESVAGRFKDNLYFYYGMGVPGGFTRNVNLLWHFTSGRPENSITRAVIGADGLLGVEYRIYSIPLSFGFEYKPFFDLFGHRIFRLALGDLGFTFRYHF
jgi:hypothetical protein